MENKQFRPEEVDQNLAVKAPENTAEAVFYDVRRPPFSLYGLYEPLTEKGFVRMPDEVAATVSSSVRKLARCSAGGRVRFSTDSPYIIIHAEYDSISKFPHMPLSGTAGFDLYIDDPDTELSRYKKTFMPPVDIVDSYESKVELTSSKPRYFTLNFPSYSAVKNLWIGLAPNATLGEGMPYRKDAPIVFYGSSITQGACASRSGTHYLNTVSRRFNRDFINLGFSGSCKAEDTMLEYLKTLPMSVFVSDYDHNANDHVELRATHRKLYEAVRSTHPDIPYLMLSRPDWEHGYDGAILRRDVVIDTYRFARENGDSNVFYIDGNSLFRGQFEDNGTVDTVHPNDFGFACMSDAVIGELSRIFGHSSTI